MKEKDEAISELLHLGYAYKDIIAILKSTLGIVISERQLYRRLKTLNLKRKNVSDPDTVIAASITDEVALHGNFKGYRQMTSVLRARHNVKCTRKQVQLLLHGLGSEASVARRCNRLRRRVYFSEGPSAIWHMDGYDKLKSYGMPIHGCIDGYSQKIIWLKAIHSNNNPKIVGGIFLQCINNLQHAPALLRTDCGTENGTAAAIQAFLHDCPDAHRYGKSTSNKRIEALWSKLRPAVQGWLDFFRDLVAQGLYEPGITMQTRAIRFSFIELINNTLDAFTLYWNTHCVRRSGECEGGVPDVLFHTRRSSGMQFDQNLLTQCRNVCCEISSKTGDSDINDYFQYLQNEVGISQPLTQVQGLDMYRQFLTVISND